MAPPWVRASTPRVAEVVEILADGLRRDLEARGEVVDRHAAGLPRKDEDLLVAVGLRLPSSLRPANSHSSAQHART